TRLPIGDPKDPQQFMGTMIHEKALTSYEACLEQAKREGFVPLLEVRRLKKDSCLVTPSIYEANASEVQKALSWKTEFFGPNVLLVPFESKEQLIDLHEASPYGLVASIFTNSKKNFDYCDQYFNTG